jgi:hypothetical protein
MKLMEARIAGDDLYNARLTDGERTKGKEKVRTTVCEDKRSHSELRELW